MLDVLALTAALHQKPELQYEEAVQKAKEAAYIQSGAREMIEEKLRFYEDLVPKEYKNKVKNILPVLDIIVKQRIELKYEF